MIDPLILFRAVHIAATVLASGTVAFTVLIAEPAVGAALADFSALRRRLTWIVWIALAVAILSEASWLVLLSAEIYGAPVIAVCLHGGVWTVLTDTVPTRRHTIASTAGLAEASGSAFSTNWHRNRATVCI